MTREQAANLPPDARVVADDDADGLPAEVLLAEPCGRVLVVVESGDAMWVPHDRVNLPEG